MADLKISALTASTTPLAGTEVLPIVQSSTTKQVSVANLTAGRAVSMLSLTADTSTLVVDSTNHRVGVGVASPGRLLELYAAGSPVLRWNDSTNTWDIRTNGSVGGAMQFDYNGTRLFTLLSGGDTHVGTGNLVFSTSGKGIDFSANTGATGMTSELLTWYEEGTWTVTGTNITIVGTPTYTGVYTRVGRQVTFSMRIQSTGSTSSVANTSYINLGFPFVSSGKLFVASVINSGTIADIGNGLVALSGGNTIVYLPTWTTLADVTISGYYFV